MSQQFLGYRIGNRPVLGEDIWEERRKISGELTLFLYLSIVYRGVVTCQFHGAVHVYLRFQFLEKNVSPEKVISWEGCSCEYGWPAGCVCMGWNLGIGRQARSRNATMKREGIRTVLLWWAWLGLDIRQSSIVRLCSDFLSSIWQS